MASFLFQYSLGQENCVESVKISDYWGSITQKSNFGA